MISTIGKSTGTASPWRGLARVPGYDAVSLAIGKNTAQHGSASMADEKYVRLNVKKMGFKFRGVVKPKRQSLLYAALETARRDMGASWKSRVAAKEIFWLNIWQEEEDIAGESDMMKLSDPKVAKALDKWCRKAVRKYCERKALIDGYGFVVNPKGTRRHQPWHVDYTTDAAAIWIPMTPFTEKNATQYIALPSHTPRELLEQVASDVDEVDVDALVRELGSVIVQQAIAEPMSILYMGRGTIHRGVPNTGDEDRVVFYISVHFIKDYEKNYPYEHESLEGVSESDVVTFEKTR